MGLCVVASKDDPYLTDLQSICGQNNVVSLPLEIGGFVSPLQLKQTEQTKPDRVFITGLSCRPAQLARFLGVPVDVIDNRVFGDPTGISLPVVSSTPAELLAAHCPPPADSEWAIRSAWRRDGWAGLSSQRLSWLEAQDKAPKLAKEADWNRALDHAKSARRDFADLTLILAPADLRNCLVDAVQRPDEPALPKPAYERCKPPYNEYDYREAQQRGLPVRLRPVLALYHPAGDKTINTVDQVEYAGPAVQRSALLELMRDADLNADFRLTLETGRSRCRLHAAIRSHVPGHVRTARVDSLVSRLLDFAFVGGRPLRRYGCTLHLPLDLRLDGELGDQEHLAEIPGVPTQNGLNRRAREGRLHSHDDAGPIPTPAKIVADLIDRSLNPDGEECRLATGDLTEEQALAQAALYLDPAIREFVFDAPSRPSHGRGDPKPIRRWRLPATVLEAMELGIAETVAPSLQAVRPLPALTDLRAKVRDVSLFGYHEGLFQLAVRVEMAVPPEIEAALDQEGDDWWRVLLSCESEAFDAIRRCQLEAWLEFTQAVRRLRPAFPEQHVEGKLRTVQLREGKAATVCFRHDHDFSPVVLRWLELLTGAGLADASRLRHVGDDRMYVNLAYGFAGPRPISKAGEEAFRRAFALALYVDREKDGWASQGGYAYDRAFVLEGLQSDTYRRWAGVGTLFGFTGYSAAAMGFGATFNGPIARVHLPFIYDRMILLALFYEASLVYFQRRITVATVELEPFAHFDAITRDFGNIHKAFIEFTNDHWFRRLTHQTQGVELFDLMTEKLGLADKYALVKDKLERVDDFIELRRDQALARAGHLLTVIGWPLAVAALLIGALQIGAGGTNLHLDQVFAHRPSWLLDSLWHRTSWRFTAGLGIAFLALFWVWLLATRAGKRLRTLLKRFAKECRETGDA